MTLTFRSIMIRNNRCLHLSHSHSDSDKILELATFKQYHRRLVHDIVHAKMRPELFSSADHPSV
jgi:hypothetical protein